MVGLPVRSILMFVTVASFGASAAGCADQTSANAADVPATVPSSPTIAPVSASSVALTTSSPTTSATTTPATTTPATTMPATTAPAVLLARASYPTLAAAVVELAAGNLAVSVSVRRVGSEPWGLAAGRRVDEGEVTPDTPFVTASVSKLVTALTVARLIERGELDGEQPVPWDEMGLTHDPAWNDVTLRELLDHTSGMPINRTSWLDDPGSCSIPLRDAMAAPPTLARTTWRYSNGNYCALGLLIEHVTGSSLDQAADDLVFAPAGISGPYPSTDGLRPDSAPYAKGVARLGRLGGAGVWLASTDDLTDMLASVTAADLDTLRWPGIILDQYGWGHTGTVDGAKACAWVIEGGRTTIAALVSGPRPGTGGDVCDRVVPALATDLGIWAGEPVRNPL